MRRNHKVLAVATLASAIALSACEDNLTEINENPNAPETVPVENVLLSGIWDVTANAGNRGAFGQWTQLYHAENWAQHVAQPVYNDEDFYVPRSGVVPLIWGEMYTALTDLDYVKDVAEADGDENLWAVAEIMTVYGFIILTDYYGDIPYTEALRLDEDYAFPAYTPQEEIYPDMIARLADAADRINPSQTLEYEGFDPIYHGDMDGWRRFANSLQLRLAMRMSNTPLSGQAATAFAAAWSADIFEAVGDAADVEWSAAQPAQNPIYEGIVLAGRTGDFRLSVSLVTTLQGLNDPRLPLYAEPAVSDGEYRGLRNGLVPADYTFGDRQGGTGDFSTIGEGFMQPTTPSVLMSYAEVLLLGAEAAERGWIQGSADALYAQGIEASMQYLDIPQAEIDTYLAQPAVGYTGLEDIWLQKWLTLYLAGPEAFSEMRRVGWLDLEPAENSTLPAGAFPARLYYPPEEELYNPVNYEAAGGDMPLEEPMWWMGG